MIPTQLPALLGVVRFTAPVESALTCTDTGGSPLSRLCLPRLHKSRGTEVLHKSEESQKVIIAVQHVLLSPHPLAFVPKYRRAIVCGRLFAMLVAGKRQFPTGRSELRSLGLPAPTPHFTGEI